MNVRDMIVHWLVQGRLQPDAVLPAYRIARIVPSRADWRMFFDRLTLWLSVIFLAAAVIFFFAYNWALMGRFAKFALVELLILAAAGACWHFDLNRASGKATVLALALLIGALLALVGQTYQSGADTFELFALWAAAILPLVLAAQIAPLWLFWIALLNLALVLYSHAFDEVFGMLGILFGRDALLWLLFGLNTAALGLWELLARRGVPWLQQRWAVRVLAVASGAQITILMVLAILDRHSVAVATVLMYAAWMGAIYWFYRHRQCDVFVLAGWVLSAIIVCGIFLGMHLLKSGSAAFLLIGLVVIGLSAVGGMWLKAVANREHA